MSYPYTTVMKHNKQVIQRNREALLCSIPLIKIKIYQFMFHNMPIILSVKIISFYTIRYHMQPNRHKTDRWTFMDY